MRDFCEFENNFGASFRFSSDPTGKPVEFDSGDENWAPYELLDAALWRETNQQH